MVVILNINLIPWLFYILYFDIFSSILWATSAPHRSNTRPSRASEHVHLPDIIGNITDQTHNLVYLIIIPTRLSLDIHTFI